MGLVGLEDLWCIGQLGLREKGILFSTVAFSPNHKTYTSTCSAVSYDGINFKLLLPIHEDGSGEVILFMLMKRRELGHVKYRMQLT